MADTCEAGLNGNDTVKLMNCNRVIACRSGLPKEQNESWRGWNSRHLLSDYALGRSGLSGVSLERIPWQTGQWGNRWTFRFE